jgi:oligopeptide/dipeptide ABC transporter ATP-binding protein
MSEPLLDVRELTVNFPVFGGVFQHRTGEVRAVDNVSLSVAAGETLGIVGESGCGKSTLAKAIVNILKPMTPQVRLDGRILYQLDRGPVDLLQLGPRAMRPLRAQIQMIFQDPFSSLNPRMTVGQILQTPLKLHTNMSAGDRQQQIAWLLERVGMEPQCAGRYPHEFSGGQRQRVGIARALALRPKLIIADEPVSALDVSVQAQVINLMQDLQEEFGLTYVFIAHDLSVVHHVSDRIAVMYLGNVVEVGDADVIYHQPAHPYTKALLSAIPHPEPRVGRANRIRLTGEIPTPLNKPSGCSFRTRCPVARESCAGGVPPLMPQAAGQLAACPFCDVDTPRPPWPPS